MIPLPKHPQETILVPFGREVTCWQKAKRMVVGPVQKKTLYYPLGLDQIIYCTEFKGNLQNCKAF